MAGRPVQKLAGHVQQAPEVQVEVIRHCWQLLLRSSSRNGMVARPEEVVIAVVLT